MRVSLRLFCFAFILVVVYNLYSMTRSSGTPLTHFTSTLLPPPPLSLSLHLLLFPRIAIANFFYVMAAGVVSIFVIYNKEKFGWEGKDSGSFLFVVGITGIIAQVWLLKWATKKWGDETTTRRALMSLSAMVFLYGFATEGWMMYAIALLTMFGLVTPATISGEYSKEIDMELQGKLQGAASSISKLADVFGSIAAGLLFSYFKSDDAFLYYPGAPFLWSFFMVLIALYFYNRATKYESYTNRVHPGKVFVIYDEDGIIDKPVHDSQLSNSHQQESP